MENALGRPPMAAKIFGGRIIPAKMEKEGRKRTAAFYKNHGMAFVEIDMMSEEEVVEFVEDIRAKLNLHECGM